GDLLDLALEELDVLRTGASLVLIGQREHLIGHIEAIGLARWANALRRQQNIDTAARAEVEDRLSSIKLGKRSGIAAAKGSEQGFSGNAGLLSFVVEIGGDRI